MGVPNEKYTSYIAGNNLMRGRNIGHLVQDIADIDQEKERCRLAMPSYAHHGGHDGCSIPGTRSIDVYRGSFELSYLVVAPISELSNKTKKPVSSRVSLIS